MRLYKVFVTHLSKDELVIKEQKKRLKKEIHSCFNTDYVSHFDIIDSFLNYLSVDVGGDPVEAVNNIVRVSRDKTVPKKIREALVRVIEKDGLSLEVITKFLLCDNAPFFADYLATVIKQAYTYSAKTLYLDLSEVPYDTNRLIKEAFDQRGEDLLKATITIGVLTDRDPISISLRGAL